MNRPGILGGPGTPIADELGYRWAFVPAFEYRRDGGFGNALLSRSPFRAVQWQLLPPRLYDGAEPSEQRVTVLAQIEASGQAVWVGSTRLPRSDAAMRGEASQPLLGLLKQLPEPWVLAGDFNQPPDTWLPNSLDVVPTPVEATYPADAPVEVIDYFVLGGSKDEGRSSRAVGLTTCRLWQPSMSAVDV